jgi:hypothetical protein
MLPRVATFSLAQRHAREAQHSARLRTRLERETGDDPHPNARMKLPGDAQALRGLPMIGGRGNVGGAIAGTRPGANLR